YVVDRQAQVAGEVMARAHRDEPERRCGAGDEIDAHVRHPVAADDDEHVVFAPAGVGVFECGAGVGSGEVEGMETPGLEFGEDLRPAGLTAPMPGGGVDENAEAMRAHPHFSVDSPASSASIFARRLAIRRSASRLTPTARR